MDFEEVVAFQNVSEVYGEERPNYGRREYASGLVTPAYTYVSVSDIFRTVCKCSLDHQSRGDS